ncbi:hypothetical protein SCUCBS95973_005241 [Sporothrix curviconia]|uniref:WD repeat protein n=1 Tax=Sporothrix curviconia TaxID=1260050 RepID=A0ABP0BVY3_9PEZI
MASMGNTFNPFTNTFDEQHIGRRTFQNGTSNGVHANGRTVPSGTPGAANGSGNPALLPGRANTDAANVNGMNAAATPVEPSAARPFENARPAGPASVPPTLERSGAATTSTTSTSTTSTLTTTSVATAAAPTPAAPGPAHDASRGPIAVSSNGYGRVAFKNPLDMWKSPSPPAKRLKMEKTTSPGARGSARDARNGRAASGGGFRRRNSDAAARAAPVQWTPQTVSLSQPMPSTSTRTGSSVLPGLRTGKKPVGFTETVENNRVVYLLDSDDEDSAAAPVSTTPASTSTSAPAPGPATVPAIAKPSAPASTSAPAPVPVVAAAPAPAPKPAVRDPPCQDPSTPTLTLKELPACLDPSARPFMPGSTLLDVPKHATPRPSSTTAEKMAGRLPPPTAAKASATPASTASANAAPVNTVPGSVTPASMAPASMAPAKVPLAHPHPPAYPWTVAGPLNANHGPSFGTASQLVTHAGIKATPVEDRSVQAVRSAPPPAGLSASQPPPSRVKAVSVSPASAVPYIPPTTPVTPAARAPSTAVHSSRTPAPVTTPAQPLPMVFSPDLSPVVHHNELNESNDRMIREKLETTVAIDMTPSRKRPKIDDGRTTQQTGQRPFVRYANLARRTYLCCTHRAFVAQHASSLPSWLGRERPQRQQAAQPPGSASTASTAPSAVIHVDFLQEEIEQVLDAVRLVHTTTASAKSSKKAAGKKHSTPERELKHLLRRQAPEFLQLVVNNVALEHLPGRDKKDLHAFLTDAAKGRINTTATTTTPLSAASTLGGPAALTLKRHDRATYTAQQQAATRAVNLSTNILMREISGQRSVPGRGRQLLNFTNAVRTLREDGLRLRNEWTNLAGDVTTISWASEDAFICGTTTHMDDRNHQYNRQGNLALASVRKGTMQAYPDHRIARSRVAPQGRAEAYDDPWLYTSVVSSDYNAMHDFAFTSSFDNTVQMWRVAKDGIAMTHQGNWKHGGKVNFVVTSSCPVCLVATAADVPVQAVRVYRLPTLQERFRGQRISYKTLSCETKPILADQWAYFPAAVRWGISEATRHLLLVGYSPRGLGVTAEDDDIPEDRRNSGELCLWDGLTGDRWRLLGGTSQNVFEVAWHPTQACFVAATAPTLLSAATKEHVRTQIRVFRQSTNAEYGARAFSEVQTLDCYADDINELALRPNSLMFMYVAAGCTNGTTYVWDTSQGDGPVHALAHGACLEEQAGETISVEDTGVKFVAWGATADRLYTGSSDGLVKAWNIRTHGASDLQPFLRNVLQCPAPVSFGVFSPSKARLAVGDASGRVFLLSVEDGMENDDEDGPFFSEDEAADHGDHGDHDDGAASSNNINKGMAPARPGLLWRSHLAFKHHPPEVIRHPTPPPPPAPAVPLGGADVAVDSAAAAQTGDDADADSGLVRARAFLSSGQIVVHPDPTIGAVKGPNYAETELFCRDFHQNGLSGLPLLAQYDRQQQENRPRASSSPSLQRALGSILPDVSPSVSFSSPTSPSSSSVLGTPDTQQSLQRQNAIRHLQSLHRDNLARDLDVNSLSVETRLALELADRAALLHLDDDKDDYGFVYEELPGEES